MPAALLELLDDVEDNVGLEVLVTVEDNTVVGLLIVVDEDVGLSVVAGILVGPPILNTHPIIFALDMGAHPD